MFLKGFSVSLTLWTINSPPCFLAVLIIIFLNNWSPLLILLFPFLSSVNLSTLNEGIWIKSSSYSVKAIIFCIISFFILGFITYLNWVIKLLREEYSSFFSSFCFDNFLGSGGCNKGTDIKKDSFISEMILR